MEIVAIRTSGATQSRTNGLADGYESVSRSDSCQEASLLEAQAVGELADQYDSRNAAGDHKHPMEEAFVVQTEQDTGLASDIDPDPRTNNSHEKPREA